MKFKEKARLRKQEKEEETENEKDDQFKGGEEDIERYDGYSIAKY